MRNDWYLHAVLTVIAGALVYLCVVVTPLPMAFAQGTRTPGESTGLGEMVIVGFRLAPGEALPVQVAGRIAADVRVTNDDLRVSGRVVTEQAPRTSTRVVVAGWEDRGSVSTAGTFAAWSGAEGRAMPVASVPPK